MTAGRGARGIPGFGARAATALAFVCAALIGGCSGLPAGGPVLDGRAVDERVRPEVRIVVPPPAARASPEQVVRGFLQAGAAFQELNDGGAPVANAYLAPGSVARWRPTSSVTVFDRLDTVALQSPTDDEIVAQVRVVATVDDTGHYREVGPEKVASVALGLVRVAGEWRIELPEEGFGLWLNTDDFGRVMSPYRIHYPSVGGRRLVPDVRWFAVGPRQATALARAQLEPVPDYLEGAVETGFPSGTTLAVDAVTVQDGIARVVLTAAASTADLEDRRAMWAQLGTTLRALPEVSGVNVEVMGGGRLSVPELSGPLRSADEVGFSADAVPLARSGWLRVGERTFAVDLSRLDGLEVPRADASSVPTTTLGSDLPSSAVGGLPSIPNAYVGFAVSPDGTDVAAVAAGGTGLARWHDRVRVEIPPFSAVFSRPSYDPQGWLWMAGSTTGLRQLWTFATADAALQSPVPVRADWLSERLVTAFGLSRDGTRVAVTSSALTGSDARLDVAGIVRDANGRPTSLAAPHRQADPLERVGELAWLDDTTLAVLGSGRAQEPVRPWIVQLGQGIGLRRIGIAAPASDLIAPVEGARFLVSTSGPRGLVVLTEPAGVLVRVGGSWREVEGATELAVQPGR
ncbi:MAG: GerMN domain-containing protein [Actinomycetales bacterium]|nr:GerMN domain-containing protein [Actinomycetales bacterium]